MKDSRIGEVDRKDWKKLMRRSRPGCYLRYHTSVGGFAAVFCAICQVPSCRAAPAAGTSRPEDTSCMWYGPLKSKQGRISNSNLINSRPSTATSSLLHSVELFFDSGSRPFSKTWGSSTPSASPSFGESNTNISANAHEAVLVTQNPNTKHTTPAVLLLVLDCCRSHCGQGMVMDLCISHPLVTIQTHSWHRRANV